MFDVLLCLIADEWYGEVYMPPTNHKSIKVNLNGSRTVFMKIILDIIKAEFKACYNIFLYDTLEKQMLDFDCIT